MTEQDKKEMRAIEMMYRRWGKYIPPDTREQFEWDCLEAEQQIKELKEDIIDIIDSENSGLSCEQRVSEIKQTLKK